VIERDEADQGQILRFFRECVLPYLWLQVEIAFCILTGVVLALADPLLLKVIVDRALGDGDPGLLLVLGGVLAGVLLFRVVFRLLATWLYSYTGLLILFELRQRVYEHVQRLSPYFFRGERGGDLLARMTSDIEVLQRAAAHTVVNAAQDLLTIGGILLVLLWLDPGLTLVLLIAYPVLIVALGRINRRLRKEGVAARKAVAGLYTFLDERLSAIRLVQEFLQERRQARQHVRLSRPWIRSNLMLSLVGALQVSLADIMASGSFIIVFLLGGSAVLAGTLSLGSLLAFYTLASRLYRPISGLIDINIDLQVARASLGRVYELLDSEPDVREAADAVVPEIISGGLRLESVGLRWPDGSIALEAVDLAVEPGRIVALVGPSGSGKSTLAALIARQLDPMSGLIELDGVDLRQWRLAGLRASVGLVTQETQLFHDTLAANLRMARRGATDAELVDALEAAGLAGFLAALSEGLDTLVGEHGLRLSGGERQRLALARMILKQPVVHILDEATSALDALTERQVLERYLERARGRTLILIAHRLTSITDVDCIHVLNAGRIVESGRHEDLYRAGGLYQTLYDHHERGRVQAAAQA